MAGGTYAIRGIALARQHQGKRIITSRIEHPAVIAVCQRLEREGFEVPYLPVDGQGLVSVSEVECAIRSDTILISLMHANNEVGTIQPIEAAAIPRSRGIVFHTDAAQSVGKVPTDVSKLGVDLVSIAGHKLYAPKGVGALYIRRGVHLERLMEGAGQEAGRRPGTENVLEIVGMGKACEVADRDLEADRSHMKRMRDALESGLRERIPDVRINGHPEQRLPNTMSVSVRGVDASDLLAEMGKCVAASGGAACHSGEMRISHVLEAMDVPADWARGTLRFSTGRMTSSLEIEKAVNVISDAIERVRDKQKKG